MIALSRILERTRSTFLSAIAIKSIVKNKHKTQSTRILPHLHNSRPNFIFECCNYFFLKPNNILLKPHYNLEYVNIPPIHTSAIVRSNINIPKRFIHKSPVSHNNRHPQTNDEIPLPKIYYIQNPMTWIVNKFDLKMLEKAWDPNFNISEFLRGSKQAVSTITSLVTDKKFDELHGLLSRSARETLLRDLENPLGSRMARLLALRPSNLQVASPRRVRFLRYEERKFCDVDMIFVGLKWLTPYRTDGLVYAEIFARFRREYTPCSIPEWTVVYFKIVKFNVLTR